MPSPSLLRLASPSAVSAQAVLFSEDFNGPTLNPVFQPTLPLAGLGNFSNDVVYTGPPNYAFQALDGASVIRLSNSLNNLRRVGWSTTTIFPGGDFRYEVRFNTLNQSPTTSVDSFIEAWVLDGANQTLFDITEPSGRNSSASREFRAYSSLSGAFNGSPPFEYQDNTWYRLVIQSAAGQDVLASILADDGTTELIGYDLGHTSAAFPDGFRLGVSQAVAFPSNPAPVDVAIDWMRLTTTPVPEPGSLGLGGLAAACVGAVCRRRRSHSH